MQVFSLQHSVRCHLNQVHKEKNEYSILFGKHNLESTEMNNQK